MTFKPPKRLSCPQVRALIDGVLISIDSRWLPGTFQNPQLLELSGIGDKDILTSFGIETKIDLPGVGENLRKPRAVHHRLSFWLM